MPRGVAYFFYLLALAKSTEQASKRTPAEQGAARDHPARPTASDVVVLNSVATPNTTKRRSGLFYSQSTAGNNSGGELHPPVTQVAISTRAQKTDEHWPIKVGCRAQSERAPRARPESKEIQKQQQREKKWPPSSLSNSARGAKLISLQPRPTCLTLHFASRALLGDPS